MSQGKILIVNTLTGELIGYFGETTDDSRVKFENIKLVELDYGQYHKDFINCPLECITVTDIENRVLEFNPPPPPKPQPTYEELQQQLLIAQGVI